MGRVIKTPTLKPSRKDGANRLTKSLRKMKEAKLARKERRKGYKEAEARGEVVEKDMPKTLNETRELDDDVIDENNEDFEEVIEAEADDEYADYFNGDRPPKILMTTIIPPKARALTFIKEMQVVIPESYYVPRHKYPVAEDLLKFANDRKFTDLVIFEIRQNRIYGIFLTHLPEGPTFHFRVSGLVLAEEMTDGVQSTSHKPELVMTNFSTALARRIQRGLHALFPLEPEFEGRRVVSWQNQHDFIFFRHYRYVFRKDGTKASLAEIGPKFTLKLRSVQQGVLDRECGKYEFFWRPKLQERHTQHYI